MDFIDCVVAGGGVIGLAVGRTLALTGLGVLVIEKNARPGLETSARNSEVIHAGLYYPTGSLKARLCREGRQRLLDYLRSRALPHRLTGKLIVAAAGQRPQLEAIHRRAIANGVPDLEPLDASEIAALEAEVTADCGLLSPGTGIFDSSAFLAALLADLEAAGGGIALHTEVTGVTREGDDLVVATRDASGEAYALSCRFFVNAAGHGAGRLAAATVTDTAWRAPTLRFARGTYFGMEGPSPFRHLVYPVPEPGGLGIHSTIDLEGQTRFGPDVEWIDAPSYQLGDERAAHFTRAIGAYWPGIHDRRLHPLFAGVRPKLSGPGEADADFLIAGPALHGTPGVLHLLGIESPGLTSSLAIAAAALAEFGLSET